ncbi:MFS general substrate transporter [Coniochaeta hoffmannii]|uniref:MFS general substrate transporter n=1 Tax=Coniochaeta hoffmannii TaxID=91930 RepID=A0AA38VDT7_9PEZI|nr:MFS general substrate transporter [Coniochaeta hoffmannii]
MADHGTAHDVEKPAPDLEQVEEHDIKKPFSYDTDPRINAFTLKEQRKIYRRIDLRLVLTLGCMYMISLLDRTNLGAASVAGMQTDLNMNAHNNAYTIVSLVFFFTYAIGQPPATVLIRKIGPRIFLSFIVFAWGVVMIGFGFVHSWQVMAVLRVILGVFEAGFYPGCVYLLSTWYPRYELQKRNAGFYLIGSMASGFGGILAYGIQQMDGLSGLDGWRWIFILEGALTCVLAFVAYLLIVDFPENSPKSWSFLSQKEADLVVARIDHDRNDVETVPFHLGSYLRHGLDSKVWGFAWLYMLTTTNTYAIAYFLPIILQGGLGFDVARAQCLVAPPYVAAAVVMVIQGYYGDKWHIRGPIIVFNCCIGMIGLGLLGYVKPSGVRYFGVFLATIACNANCPVLLTYQSNNIRGQWKRAFTSATLIGGGAIGGIIGTTVFRPADKPGYKPGILACMIANALMIVIVGMLSFKFYRANKRVDRGGKQIEGYPGFKYTF